MAQDVSRWYSKTAGQPKSADDQVTLFDVFILLLTFNAPVENVGGFKASSKVILWLGSSYVE